MRATICAPKRRAPVEEDDGQSSAGLLNAANPITSLFSQSGSFGVVSPSGRRTLGPRVAFAPVSVWVGAQPGGNDDEALMRGRGRTRLARGRRAKAMMASKAGAPTPAAIAFTASSTRQIMSGKKLEEGKGAEGAHANAAARPKRGAIQPKVAGANPGAKPAAKTPKKKSASAKN